jgi:hypothetical protein
MIVDPEYVDQLAMEIVTLGMEIEQFRAALAEQARRDALQPTTDPIFKATCRQLAQYIETRAKKAENLSAIAIRYGTHCKQQGGRVLVGKEWVVYQRFDKITIVACIEAAQATSPAASS